MTSHRWLAMLAFSVTMLATMMIVSVSAPVDPLRLRTANGLPVRALRESADSVLVLLYDPADVFACSSALQEWRRRESNQELRVRLVFTRKPTALETRQLRVARLDPVAVVRPRLFRRTIQSEEFLFVGGRLVRSSKAPSIGSRSPFFLSVVPSPAVAAAATEQRENATAMP
jgi:hypothetical protein